MRLFAVWTDPTLGDAQGELVGIYNTEKKAEKAVEMAYKELGEFSEIREYEMNKPLLFEKGKKN